MENAPEPPEAEITNLIEAIHREHGHDFRGYALSSLKRRILSACAKLGYSDLRSLRGRVLTDATALKAFLEVLTIPTTEMFRDPSYFGSLRATVAPWLRTFPSVRVWSAGCSSGQEAFSLAIALHEEGLLERTLIYATDISSWGIEEARRGRIAAQCLQAPATPSFAGYFRVEGSHAVLDDGLLRRICFMQHNLATDGSFSEVQLISCRNVLIYFNADLRRRAMTLFRDSLSPEGFLGLGLRESLAAGSQTGFEPIDRANRIYRLAK